MVSAGRSCRFPDAPRFQGLLPVLSCSKFGCCGERQAGRTLRWKSFVRGRSWRGMFPILGWHRVSYCLSQMPWKPQVPQQSRSGGLRCDWGITHKLPVDCTLLGKVKTYSRKSRTETNQRQQRNHNGFLAPFRPRNRLFIADACWQKENPLGQRYQGFISNPQAVQELGQSESREGTFSGESGPERTKQYLL